jgi:hypothetical protein
MRRKRTNGKKPRGMSKAHLPDNARCIERAVSTGLRCERQRVKGTAYCERHGENKPPAKQGRPGKNGRFSRLFTGRLQELYDDAVNDADLWDLGRHIALLDAIVAKSAERLREFDTPEFRSQAIHLFRKVQAEQDPAAFQALGELLERGAQEDSALEDLAVNTERMAKRLEAGWRIRLDAAQSINVRDMVTILARFVDIVRISAGDAVADDVHNRVGIEIMGALPVDAPSSVQLPNPAGDSPSTPDGVEEVREEQAAEGD